MTKTQKEIRTLSKTVHKAAKDAGLEPLNVIAFAELGEEKALCQQAGDSMSDDENLFRCMYDVYDYAGFKLRGTPKALIAVY